MDKDLKRIIDQIPLTTTLDKFKPNYFNQSQYGKVFEYYRTLSDGIDHQLDTVDQSIAISRQPLGQTPWHLHNYIELTFIMSGQAEIVVKNKTIKLSTGQILLMGQNTIHCLNLNNPKTVIFNLAITSNFLTEERLMILRKLSTVAKMLFTILRNDNIDQAEYSIFDATDNSAIQDTLAEIIVEYYQPNFGSQEIINLDVLKLLVELIRLRQLQQPQVIANETSDVFDMLIYIENNYRNLSLTQMSEVFHFHPNYLSAKLKTATGMSFSQLISLQKLNTAAAYLIHSHDTVSQISERIGYTDTSYFYQEFKKFFKTTPIQYRKQNQLS